MNHTMPRQYAEVQSVGEDRSSEIASAMENLSNNIAGLESALGALGARLAPVTIPVPPSETKSTGPVPVPMRSALGNSIFSESERVAQLSFLVTGALRSLAI